MKLTVNSQYLAQELRLLVKVLSSKPVMPILNYVRLEAAEDGLHLTTTDIDVSLTTPCQAEVEAPGAVMLPAQKLLKLVEQFPNAPVTLAQEDASVVVKCNAFASKMQTLPIQEAPVIPTLVSDLTALNASVVRRMILMTRYAISTSTAKFVMQGSLLAVKDGAIAMVATDGKRLALVTAGTESQQTAEMLVPYKVLDQLVHQLAGAEEVKFGASSNHLFFVVDQRIMTSRMMEGKFPEWRKIIPAEDVATRHITLNRAEFLAALKRVAVVSEANKVVYLIPSRGLMTLSALSTEVGTAEESLPAEYEGPQMKLCLDADYLTDFLEQSSSPQVTLKTKNATSHLRLEDAQNYLGVISPMRDAKRN